MQVTHKKIILSILLIFTFATQNLWAQFDSEDFPPPPPPPPPSDYGTGSSYPPPNIIPEQSQVPKTGSAQASPPLSQRRTQPQPMRPMIKPTEKSPTQTTKSPIVPMKNQTQVKNPTPNTETKKETLANAGIEDITNENYPETIESFDFPNAEITDIVKAISELTGKNFIIDPGVRGKITVIAPSKITVAEAYKAFLSALAINGFAVVPSGKFLKIRSSRNAQRDGIETYSGNYYPNADQMITRIIHLKHISAEMVNRDLRILTSKDGELSPYTPTNSLIISDYGSNIERVMKIINQLDVPGFEDQLEVVPIHFAKAKDISELVNKIVNKGDTHQQQQGAFSAGIPRFSRSTTTQQGSSGSAYFMVIPDDRTNSLIVVGNKPGIVRVKKLISQLDFRIRADESGGIHVYYLKYGDAEKIAQTLSSITKETAPKPATSGPGGFPGFNPITGVQAPQEIFGGDVKITADKGNNALVIVASKQDYDVILDILSKLDIARDQVYVEAIIMEMKLTDSLNWQIGYFQYDKSGSGAHSGFNGFQDISSLLNPTGGSGAILGFGSSDTVNIKNPTTGATTPMPSLVSFVNFLKANTNANILSTPQILALDNQEATIEVGDKIVTGQTTTTAATGAQQSTPIFEDATIKLKIKPFISPSSNSIRMEIENSVKQPSTAKTPTGLQSTTQPLATRSIKTNIVVPNGDTAVLGGLMKEDELEQIQKVPWLGDLPILGWLFKSRSISKEKTNMTIFLTPKIIRNPEDTKAILNKKIDQRLGFIKDMGGRDPYGKTIDEIQGVRVKIDEKDIKK